MDKTSLGDRMKAYENAVGAVLIPRMPTIIRVDGKAFHTFTKKITATNDPSSVFGPSVKMHTVMMQTAASLCAQIQNAVFAYTQSDEISILLRDYDNFESQQWFGGKVQKMVSVSASMATAYFNEAWDFYFRQPQSSVAQVKQFNDFALFDSRVFQIPKEDVANYFVWRQKDAVRNSINFVARKYFSHKQLHGKNTNEVQEMLWNLRGINWNDFTPWKKRGSCVVPSNKGVWERGVVCHDDIPIFTSDRAYIEKHIFPSEGTQQ